MVKEKGKKPHSKTKHKNVKVWEKYKDGKIHGRFCPRCGPGTLMADHGDRVTCGRCHYSDIKVEKK